MLKPLPALRAAFLRPSQIVAALDALASLPAAEGAGRLPALAVAAAHGKPPFPCDEYNSGGEERYGNTNEDRGPGQERDKKHPADHLRYQPTRCARYQFVRRHIKENAATADAPRPVRIGAALLLNGFAETLQRFLDLAHLIAPVKTLLSCRDTSTATRNEL